jgi:hypothetical protein
MTCAPAHAQRFLSPAGGGVDVQGTFGPNHPVWKVQCPCGAGLFDLLASALPRFVARCITCPLELVVYDVRECPAATVGRAGDTLRPGSRREVSMPASDVRAPRVHSW